MPALWRRAHAGIRCGPLCNHIFGYTCAVILGIYTGMLAAQFILVLLCVVPCLVLAAGMKISLLITHKAVLALEANLPDKKEVRPAKTQETVHERKRVKKAERQELKKLRRRETRARRMWLTIHHQISAEHGWLVAALCHPRCFECFCSGMRSFAYIVTAWVSFWSLVRLHNAHALTAAAVAFLAAGSGLFLLRRYPSRCAAILRIRWLEGLASPWLSYVRRKYDEASSKQATRAGAARKILSLKLQVRKPCCLDIRRREEERRWRDLMEPWRKRMRERSTRRAAAKLRRAGWMVRQMVYAKCATESFQKRGVQGPGQPSEMEPLISDKDGVPQGADPLVMEMACDPCPSNDRWFAHLAYLCSAEACAKGSGKGADAMSRPLREGIRVNRDQNARPRGGGVDEDIYDVGESRASNHALLQGIDLPAEPPAESCLRNAVQCTRIYGNIGGALHIAANTHGDGACALHAVWGRADPERHMDLFAREVRRAVLEEVPENALTICGLLQGQLSDKFQALMDSVWKELVLPAATAVVDEQSWPSREAAIAWVATASHVQEAIIHFAAQRRHEEAALKDFAAEFFKPEYEADVIRPLCILLGYLTDATVNLFENPPSAAGLLQHEGEVGALERLHPCFDKPECTKYQALFDPSPRFNKYRVAFFANTEHNRHAGQQEWLLNAFNTLAGSLAEEGKVSHAERLRRGHVTVARHYDGYGSLEHPPQWGSEVAWGVLRCAILDETYWLSVEELQFLAACCRIGVRVYKFDEAEAADSVDAYKFEPIGDDLYTDLPEMEECVHVVFESSDAGSSSRGHFSRLWTEEAWLEEALAADDPADEESCATSDDGSESDAEDGQSSEPGQGDDPDPELPNPADAQPGDGCDGDGKTDDEQGGTGTGNPYSDDVELDALSDISENSDIFHAEVLPAAKYVETREDLERRLSEELSTHLRLYPLLPANPSDPSESFMDVASGIRFPNLHCAFKGCPWAKDCPMAQHWEMEWLLFNHIKAAHKEALDTIDCTGEANVKDLDGAKSQTAGLLAYCEKRAENRDGGFIALMSFYINAICVREQEHVPLIGPAIDRRTLTLVTRLANSATIQSKVCFCCAQVHVHAKAWTKMYKPATHGLPDSVGYRHVAARDSKADIEDYTAEESLHAYRRRDSTGFDQTFSRDRFVKEYATEGPTQGNAFANSHDFYREDGKTDWVRVMAIGKETLTLLCCPEDVRSTAGCRHDPDANICKHCRIPLCHMCAKVIMRAAPGGIPMSLCNDNFIGYTTDVIMRFRVTWLEAAIVAPCWTTMLVCYVEGDRGHLVSEELGRQSFRTRVRGSACSFHMIAFINIVI